MMTAKEKEVIRRRYEFEMQVVLVGGIPEFDPSQALDDIVALLNAFDDQQAEIDRLKEEVQKVYSKGFDAGIALGVDAGKSAIREGRCEV
jgi:hypothetical protein